jgi:conjugative relaxase-like TrwC/TraI family protein
MAQVTLKSGFDVDYHLGQVGVDYHLTAGGEPPGRWMGRGAEALGLSGRIGGTSAEGEANAEAMRGLYHYDVTPDGTPLVTSQRRHQYPDKSAQLAAAQERIDARITELGQFATPEEIRDIEIQERAKVRSSTPFIDMVLSVEKSVSLLQVGFRAAAKRARDETREHDAEQLEARAERIDAAIEETASEIVAWIEQHLVYVRTGHHSATSGEWRDADGLVVGAFVQHTNRDGEPNLHIHLEILNRARRADGADDKWRALHGRPLWAEKLYLGALTTRILTAKLAALGIPLVKQEDGNGFDVAGIERQTMAAYSKRSADVDARKRELVAQYERDHEGRAPDRATLYRLRKKATTDTREAKAHPPKRTAEQEAEAAARELGEWMRQAEDESVQLLESLPAAVDRFAAERGPSRMPSEAERARAIRVGVAEVQRQNSAWTRGKLIWEMHRALGQLPAEADPVAYLEAMADDALGGQPGPVPEGIARGLRFPVAAIAGTEIIRIAPVPDVTDTARLGLRRDGASVYRPPGEERFVTKPHLDSEEWVVKRAAGRRPQLVTEAEAEAALADTDLDYQQREVVKGMLTSQTMAECLVAPAGSGKTHVMAAFAKAWAQITGGRVIGITLGENAARVMADEGMTETYNLARFLGKIKDSDQTRGHVPVYENDVLVLDEATQFGTEDLVRLWQILETARARVKPVGDTEQLGPVEAGGMFRLMAREHGNWKLAEVRRFTESWEAPASLRLRDGEVLALGEYNRHGRVHHGAADRMREDAVDLWLTDYLRGKNSLLMAGSNEAAAELARMAREQLAERGRLGGPPMVTLSDGNQAGTGDLVRARLNTKIEAGGQTLANRDVLRITGWRRAAGLLTAEAVRQTAEGGWSAPFPVPASYLNEHAELGYAGNVFTAQGRTVDAGYLLVDESMTRDLAYVGMTRGRERNVIFVQTGPPDPAAPSHQDRMRADRERLQAAHEHLQRGDTEAALQAFEPGPEPGPTWQAEPWEAVMAQVLAKDDPLGTALEQMKAAQDYATNIGHLVTISEAFWWADVVPQIDQAVQTRLTPAEAARYMSDPERPALLQLIREHELGGRPVAETVEMITERSMAGAHSIAAVMHGRLEKAAPPARGQTQTFAERVPGGAAPQIGEIYQAADERQAEVGRELAERPEEWALKAWGVPPAEAGALRDDWERRAGLVGAYRQAAGITDPDLAIGPVPAGKGILREMFSASVRALELPDERALMAAMGNEDLEARLVERERAVAVAPADVSVRLASVERQRTVAAQQAEQAAEASDQPLAQSAEALVQIHDRQLASLRVADAAHREWAEAHAPLEDSAKAADRELRARHLEGRIPVTDSEVAATSAEPRETPPMDPAEWARLKAEQTAQHEADRQAQHDRLAQACPVTDAEVEKYGGRLDPEVSPEAAQELAELQLAGNAELRAELAARNGEMARLYPVTDAELAQFGGERPDDGPRPDPETAAAVRAEQARQPAEAREAAAADMGRLIPVTEPEMIAASAEPRDYPAPGPDEVARWRQEAAEQLAQARERERTVAPETGPEPAHVDPEAAAAQKAAQSGQVAAEREARHEAAARHTPVTGAEVAAYSVPQPEPQPGGITETIEDEEPSQRLTPEPEPESAVAKSAQDRSEALVGLREDVVDLGAKVDELARQETERAAERAEIVQTVIDEPSVREPQAEPSLERSWQPGSAQGQYELDSEMEMGL